MPKRAPVGREPRQQGRILEDFLRRRRNAVFELVGEVGIGPERGELETVRVGDVGGHAQEGEGAVTAGGEAGWGDATVEAPGREILFGVEVMVHWRDKGVCGHGDWTIWVFEEVGVVGEVRVLRRDAVVGG